MGDKYKIESPEFRKSLETLLDSLATSYNEDLKIFVKSFKSIDKDIKREMIRISKGNYNDTEHEDLADYSKEVLFYYESHLKKVARAKKVRTFTLRNSEDLDGFYNFMVEMNTMLENNPKKFLREFPKCNPIYWDKIDDLREASYTYEYGSDKYVKCLHMCKHLSYSYSDMVDIKEITINKN